LSRSAKGCPAWVTSINNSKRDTNDTNRIFRPKSPGKNATGIPKTGGIY